MVNGTNKPIDTSSLRPIIGNNPINVPNSNINKIAGPSVISTIEKPAIRDVDAPVVRGLEVPIVDVPNTRIPYPVINVPTQAEFDAAVKAEREKQAAEQQEKQGDYQILPSPSTASGCSNPSISNSNTNHRNTCR